LRRSEHSIEDEAGKPMVAREGGADLERRHGLRAVGTQDPASGRRVESGRRWDDRPGQFPALTFARFLESRPSVDDAARFLVALLCWPIAAQGALVVKTSGGRTHVLGAYVDQVPDWPDRGVLPADVLDTVAEIGDHPVIRTAELAAGRRPIAAWPLGPRGRQSGVLVVILSSELDPRLVDGRTTGIADILAVYLVGSGGQHVPARATQTTERGTHSLTSRQLTILSLMGQKLTNDQIAGRIGFSASTVRMESLAIYRELGVHDRYDAVISGTALGLVEFT
jgi:DNA-binding CsgD family transcriptional regulator